MSERVRTVFPVIYRKTLAAFIAALMMVTPTAAQAKGRNDSKESSPTSRTLSGYDDHDDDHDDRQDDEYDDEYEDEYEDDYEDDENDENDDEFEDEEDEDSEDDSQDEDSSNQESKGPKSSRTGSSTNSQSSAQREWRTERTLIDKKYNSSVKKAEATLKKDLKSADTPSEKREARSDYSASINSAKELRNAAIKELGPMPQNTVDTRIAKWKVKRESIENAYSASLKRAEVALRASLKKATSQDAKKEAKNTYNEAVSSAKKARATALKELGPAPKK